jgi:hypothetical protein
VLLVAALAQPLAADVRTGQVLRRADTRELVRAYLERTLRPQARVVIEPASPLRFFRRRYVQGFAAPPRTPGELNAGVPSRFIAQLSPARIAAYRAAGYCTVVKMSLVAERARIQRVPAALAYYRALDREARVVFRASPYRPGAAPVPFDFDISTHLYYPSAYERPGPEVTVYRLDDCRQGYGR